MGWRSLLGEGGEAAATGDADALAERLELAVSLQAVDRRRDDGALDAGALGDFGGGDAGVLEHRFDDPLLVGALGGAAVAAWFGAAAGAADRLARARVGVDPGLGEQRHENVGGVALGAAGHFLAFEQREDALELLELVDDRPQLADPLFNRLPNLLDRGAHRLRRDYEASAPRMLQMFTGLTQSRGRKTLRQTPSRFGAETIGWDQRRGLGVPRGRGSRSPGRRCRPYLPRRGSFDAALAGNSDDPEAA